MRIKEFFVHLRVFFLTFVIAASVNASGKKPGSNTRKYSEATKALLERRKKTQPTLIRINSHLKSGQSKTYWFNPSKLKALFKRHKETQPTVDHMKSHHKSGLSKLKEKLKERASSAFDSVRTAATSYEEAYWCYGGIGSLVAQLTKDLADAFVVTSNKAATRKALRSLSLVASMAQATGLAAGGIAKTPNGSTEGGADYLRRALLITASGLEIASAADSGKLIKNDARYAALIKALSAKNRRQIRAVRLKNMAIRLGISTALLIALIGIRKRWPSSPLSTHAGSMVGFSMINMIANALFTNEKGARFDLENQANRKKKIRKF